MTVCRNCLIGASKLLKGKAYNAYNEAKKGYFYGFKVQLITTAEGQPLEYAVYVGSFHDAMALQEMQLALPVGFCMATVVIPTANKRICMLNVTRFAY